MTWSQPGENATIWHLFLWLTVTLNCLATQANHNCYHAQYYNTSLGTCQACTNCSSMGLHDVSPCSAETDAVCKSHAGHQLPSDCSMHKFYNITSGLCQSCTVCASNYAEVRTCTIGQDAECVQKCPSDYIYLPSLDTCSLDCTHCPANTCKNQFYCLCEPACCYDATDALCRFNLCESNQRTANCTDSSDTGGTNSKDDLLSTDIVLVVGAVLLGMLLVTLLVAACIRFVCFYKPASSRRQLHPSTNSDSSEYHAQTQTSSSVPSSESQA